MEQRRACTTDNKNTTTLECISPIHIEILENTLGQEILQKSDLNNESWSLIISFSLSEERTNQESQDNLRTKKLRICLDILLIKNLEVFYARYSIALLATGSLIHKIQLSYD